MVLQKVTWFRKVSRHEGKKMYQKKESLKIKDLDREAKREMRER